MTSITEYLSSLCYVQIPYEDVDFFGMDSERLKAREMSGLYPPRFIVSIDGSGTTVKALANFTLSGALKNNSNDDLKYPMQLLPHFPQPIMQGRYVAPSTNCSKNSLNSISFSHIPSLSFSPDLPKFPSLKK